MQNIREEVIKVGEAEFNAKIQKARQDPAVTISIDAGTLSHRHMIDICLTSPSLRPIFYKSIPKQVAGVEEYISITESEVKTMFNKFKINVVAIVTDNLPVQIIALAHWSPTSILNISEDPRVRKILLFPCLCHTTQLIVECTEENDIKFAELNGTLRSMISILRNNSVISLIGSTCPQFVATRWLSRMESIDFILRKKEKILEIVSSIDSLDITDQIKPKIVQIFTEINFIKIKTLGELVYPFYVLIKIFEKNNSRQFLAVPCFDQLMSFINARLNKQEFLEYHPTLLEFSEQLKIRKKKTLHWELLLLSFVLTLPGRLWLRKQILEEHKDSITIDNKELQYQFKNLVLDYLVEDDGNLDRIDVDFINEDDDSSSEGIINQNRAEQPVEDPKDIFSYRSVLLQHVNVPIPPSHSNGLFDSVLETLKEVSVRINGNCDSIEESFSFYIFNNSLFNKFSKFKDIRSHPEIGWLQEVLNPKLKNLVNVALHILPVISSETSVERCFSQQKQILSELRLRSKDDLVNARFILAE